jgi:hypothetical protein
MKSKKTSSSSTPLASRSRNELERTIRIQETLLEGKDKEIRDMKLVLDPLVTLIETIVYQALENHEQQYHEEPF